MRKPKIAVADLREGKIAELVAETDHRTLVAWALDCAGRVLPLFEDRYPDDGRPRAAIEAGRAWVRTGVFKMKVIRKASLDSHAAAREVADDDAARSAARAAGHAVAAAHVPSHGLAAAAYAATAVRNAFDSGHSETALARERQWQYEHLVEALRCRKASRSD